MWIVQPETAAAAGEIKVKGIDILQAQDCTVQCGSGTAKYEPDTNTLTLNQADIADDGNALAYGIEIGKEGVTVELVPYRNQQRKSVTYKRDERRQPCHSFT